MKTFYFTGTGNSLCVAKRIGGELYSIPQILKEGKYKFEADVIGLVFPCYGFGLPRIVLEFLKQSKLKANFFFAVMTYGNISASGLKHIEDTGREMGIRFNYTNEILLIDNYLPLFKIEDQLEKESSKKIEEKLNQIINDINNRQEKQIRKGILSNFISRPVNNLTIKHHCDFGDKAFSVNNNCNSCKICEKVCPTNNIKVRVKPEYMHKCESCFACIHHCPQNAIHVKFERSKARFINQNVNLKEIMEANNQL